MKVTIELPEKTMCAFVNYVFHSGTGLSMGVKSISTDDIKAGYVLVEEQEEK